MNFLDQIPVIFNELQDSINFFGLVFYAFAILIIVSGLITVLSKRLMRSAVALLFTFFGVAGLYAMLAADFIAVTQIMVYIGGILTLIIFGVMLTSRITDINKKSTSLGRTSVVIGSIIAAFSGIFLSIMFINADWKQAPLERIPDGTINLIGNLMLTDYLAAFIVSAILLLIAFIGAALIARRKN